MLSSVGKQPLAPTADCLALADRTVGDTAVVDISLFSTVEWAHTTSHCPSIASLLSMQRTVPCLSVGNVDNDASLTAPNATSQAHASTRFVTDGNVSHFSASIVVAPTTEGKKGCVVLAGFGIHTAIIDKRRSSSWRRRPRAKNTTAKEADTAIVDTGRPQTLAGSSPPQRHCRRSEMAASLSRWLNEQK
jgi:hypothetical protein